MNVIKAINASLIYSPLFCCRTQSARSTFVSVRQTTQCASNRKTFYKQDSTNCEKIETTETVCCVSKTVYWCDVGLRVECFVTNAPS
jgi:hypothetical protein